MLRARVVLFFLDILANDTTNSDSGQSIEIIETGFDNEFTGQFNR